MGHLREVLAEDLHQVGQHIVELGLADPVEIRIDALGFHALTTFSGLPITETLHDMSILPNVGVRFPATS